jgi:aminopeptidase N
LLSALCRTTALLARAGLLVLLAAAPDASAFEVADHDVLVRVDPDARIVRGQQTLRVVGPAPRTLTFPRHRITVASCTGATVEASADALRLTLPAALGAGEVAEIHLTYEARSPDGVTMERDLTTTAFHTCNWMICKEEPGSRSTATLRIVAPPGHDVVASGEPVSHGALPDGTAVHVFRQRAPVPAFLLGFVVGRLERVTGQAGAVTLEVLGHDVPPELLAAVLEATRPMVAEIEQMAGLPLPLSTYRQVIVPGGAAQEAAGFALIGQDHVAALLYDPTEDWVVFHELAHQVWGSLLACRTWEDLWLNEAVVTYLVGAWKQRRFGHQHHERELRLARERWGRVAREGFDVPLTHPGPWPSLRAKRAIVYSKGALLLAELRRELGDARFSSALRSYTRRHAGGIVTTRAFLDAFEQEAGRPLAALAAPWFQPARE